MQLKEDIKLIENKDSVFTAINCFDYSEFCSDQLDINEFPTLSFYEHGILIKKFDYLPENNIIMDSFKRFIFKYKYKIVAIIKYFIQFSYSTRIPLIISNSIELKFYLDEAYLFTPSNILKIVIVLENDSAGEK